MYSILIKDEKGTSLTYFAKNGTVFAGTLTEVKSEYIKLLSEYTAFRLVVVHNTTVDLTGLTIADVSA